MRCPGKLKADESLLRLLVWYRLYLTFPMQKVLGNIRHIETQVVAKWRQQNQCTNSIAFLHVNNQVQESESFKEFHS